MARTVRKRKPDPPPASPLAAMMEKHLADLRVKNYSEYTVKNRRGHIGFFIQWCHDRGLTEPTEVTRPVLEHYQRYLFHYRQKNGKPLTFRSQLARLVPTESLVPLDGTAAVYPAQSCIGTGAAED